MGRHSSAARWHFIRSVIVWAAPWLAVAVVVSAVGWLALSALTDEGARPAAAGRGATGGEGGEGTGERPAAPTTPQPTTPEPTSRPSGGNRRQVLVTRGVTVQVLDTTGRRIAGRWAGRLRKLGFEVVSVQPGLGPYPVTTVYWSGPSDRAAARALAARFGWSTGRRPESLSPTVSIHVVLGDDAG